MLCNCVYHEITLNIVDSVSAEIRYVILLTGDDPEKIRFKYMVITVRGSDPIVYMCGQSDA